MGGFIFLMTFFLNCNIPGWQEDSFYEEEHEQNNSSYIEHSPEDKAKIRKFFGDDQPVKDEYVLRSVFIGSFYANKFGGFFTLYFVNSFGNRRKIKMNPILLKVYL